MRKSCTECGQTFEITQEDLAFYEKVSPVFGEKRYDIPPPTLCPQCRIQRRIVWRNERKLYHRKCDLTGRQIISVYKSDSQYTVYEHKEWYSDKWDPLQYGQDFDFKRSFFAQFHDLLRRVPRPSLDVKADNENCDYTNLITRSRNCYLVFASSDCEDCMYTSFLQRNRSVCDCFFIFDSELCYECIDCYHGYNLRHCQYVENCSDSSFLYNCKGCRNCFGCVNLVNREFHFFNEPLPKEEYKARVAQIITNPEFLTIARTKVLEFRSSLPQKYFAGVSNENITGDHVSYSRNALDCFDCTYLEDCKYCIWFHQSRNCHDCYGWGKNVDFAYENHLVGNDSYNVRFGESCWEGVSDLLYCNLCVHATQNCFGCMGLKRKQHCILNKQYSQEEYEKLVPIIIEHMQKTGEWGEFFPHHLSPFGYNETMAYEYFPLTQEEVQKRGWSWYDDPSEQENYMGPRVELPDSIKDVDDSIVQKILRCEASGKAYKIIPQELRLYRQMDIPPPRKSPNERHRERFAQRNPRKLRSRQCAKCGKEIQTTYAPERPETVYCESCYLQTVY